METLKRWFASGVVAALVLTFAAKGSSQEPAELEKYWLGLQLAEVPELARAQLKIEGGIAVEGVSPDSPAASAGVLTHDILLMIDNHAVTRVDQVLKAVRQATKDEQQVRDLKLVMLRNGERREISLKPAKRPDLAASAPRGANADALFGARKHLEEAMKRLKVPHGEQGELNVLMFGPGIVTQMEASEMPANLNITITKEGKQPAKIHVKQDDKEWTVTEDKLDDLPADIRRHVQRMTRHAITPETLRLPGIGTPPAPGFMHAWPKNWGAPQFPNAQPPSPNPASDSSAMEKKMDALIQKLDQVSGSKLDELQKELKQLRKEVDELRKK